MTFFIIGLKLLCAYLLGSLSGSLVLGKLRGVDIRNQGSGNAGGTNALRTQGIWFALGVVLIDIGKGYLACTLVANAVTILPAMEQSWLLFSCGLMAVLGHIFPVFFHFRGGKGVATAMGVVTVLLPVAGAWVLLLWFFVLLVSGYVGLASICAAIFLPVSISLQAQTSSSSLVFGFGVAVLIVWAHRYNISRLIAGTENRFEKARWQYWLKH